LPALTGYLDEAGRDTIGGWAEIPGEGKPVELDILIAATLNRPAVQLHRCLANRYRADRDPGHTLCHGRLGFALDSRRLKLPLWSFCLEVRQVGGDILPGAPRLVAHASFQRERSPFRVIELDGRPVSRLPSDMLLWPPRQGGANTVIIPPDLTMLAMVTPQRDVPGEARRLGVDVYRIALDGREIPLHSPALCHGFYPMESDSAGRVWRWAGPVAIMDLGPSSRPRNLEVDIGDPVMVQPRPARVGMGYQAVFCNSPGREDWRAPYIGRHWLTQSALSP